MLLALTLALVASCTATDPAEARAAYHALKQPASNDAPAHVELALWCERNGLDRERAGHLKKAVEADPNNAAARSLLGHVSIGREWISPDQMPAHVRSDADLSKCLADYQARREATPATAEAQWKLALWCEEKGLAAEAEAHFARVTQLDPTHAPAWRRLGCVRYEGRWMPRTEATAARAEARAAEQGASQWQRRLVRYRDRLDRGVRVMAAQAALNQVEDPHAVPAIWSTFVVGPRPSLEQAVTLLGQIPGPAASRALAILSVFPESDHVRRIAAETLARRDPREATAPLIDLLEDAFEVDARPAFGPGDVGSLAIEGPRSVTIRVYPAPSLPAFLNDRGTYTGFDTDGFRIDSNSIRNDYLQAANAAAAMLTNDLRLLMMRSERVRQTNGWVSTVLSQVTQEALTDDPDLWRAWFADRLGYSYTPHQGPKPIEVVPVQNPYPVRQFSQITGYRAQFSSCFAARTPVLTRMGPVPIENLKVGDVVLAQDIETGDLKYAPVISAYHNPPAPTLRIVFADGESITSTPIHRFWKPGEGWIMARELGPGDRLRCVGGVAVVARIEARLVQPVYNLDVAGARNFMVGTAGLLVHDFSMVEPVTRAFDVPRPGAPE